MTADQLSDALRVYRELLDRLPAIPPDEVIEHVALLLGTRDDLAHALREAPSTGGPWSTILPPLDERLRQSAGDIAHFVGQDRLEQWRHSVCPDEKSWWWYLDRIPTRSRPAWALAEVPLLMAALGLTVLLLFRFLALGEAFLGFLSAFLAAVQGSRFTDIGRSWLLEVGKRLGWHDRLGHRGPVVFAALLLVLAIGLSLSFPALARYHNNQGDRLRAESARAAVHHFEAALRYRPDYAIAHYNLGDVREDLGLFAAASESYELSIRSDPSFSPPYNNLARLKILDDEPLAALRLLEVYERFLPETARAEDLYALHRNRGHAYLALEQPELARAELEEAIREAGRMPQDLPRGAAHCLLAQTLETLQVEALEEWKGCIGNSDKDRAVEPGWIALANRKVPR